MKNEDCVIPEPSSGVLALPSGGVLAKSQQIDLEEIQRLFTFAWEHTLYRANLVALRTALGLMDAIILPVDESVRQMIGKDATEGPATRPDAVRE